MLFEPQRGPVRMNFFDSEFARYARATVKRRRGWALLTVVVVCWALVVAIGYGLFLVVRQTFGA
jgi:hypothetical protein